MGAATVIEKYRGSAFVNSAVYSSAWFVALWTLLAILATIYMLRRRLQRHPVTFMLHLSLLVILAGAGITWVTGKEGTIHLRQGDVASGFTDSHGATVTLGADVAFTSLVTVCYPGTDTPRAFECHLSFSGENGGEGAVGPNRVLSHNGTRYFLTSFDDDGGGVTLRVSRNSAGMGVSYTGYALLALSMILFFFCKDTRFRALRYKKAMTLAIGVVVCGVAANASPRTVSPDVADALGRLHVYYKGRICPVNTMALDLTRQLYGSSRYNGYSANRVLAGWIFYPSEWVNTVDLNPEAKRQAVELILSGDMMKIFPYSCDGIKWASPVTRVDISVAADQRIFMRRALDYIGEQIISHDDSAAVELIGKLGLYQQHTAATVLPSPARFRAELLYNRLPLSLPLAIYCFITGIIIYIHGCRTAITGRKEGRFTSVIADTIIIVPLLLLTFLLSLSGYVAGHIPMTNGFETMQCMAWCALIGALVMSRRFAMGRAFGLLVAAMALLVAMMSEKNPAITYIVPVLDSPWLCVHVMLMMISYSLLAFVMLGGISGLLLRRRHNESAERMAIVGLRILYPAVFTLAAGIFTGAVWANETWGRFWGWDPKEVWALITLLIYAAPLHGEFGWLKNGGKRFHIYALLAFLSVAVTYFGVNYLLGGLHSYAMG